MSEIPDYNGRVSKIDYKSTSIQPKKSHHSIFISIISSSGVCSCEKIKNKLH